MGNIYEPNKSTEITETRRQIPRALQPGTSSISAMVPTEFPNPYKVLSSSCFSRRAGLLAAAHGGLSPPGERVWKGMRWREGEMVERREGGRGPSASLASSRLSRSSFER